MILDLMRRTIIPPLWAVFRRIPGGIKFWQGCTKALHISPDSRVASAKQVAIAQTSSFYDRDYFEKRKNVLEESGYDGYEPGTLEPEVAEAVKCIFKARRVLDVGCAKGFLVDALRKMGLDAWGIDFSEYAISQAIPSAHDYVSMGNVLDLDFPDNAFGLILCFETLEHLESDKVDQAIDQLYRVASDKVWITAPCMGVNDYGPPPGWPQGKIREQYCPMYETDQDFPDPALLEHLPLDRRGFPLQGHITIASFRWWTEHFLRRGFTRRGDFERRVNSDIEAARIGWLNCMVFEKTVPAGQPACTAPASVLLKTPAGDAQTPLVWQPDQPGTARSDPIHLEPGRYTATLHIGITQIPPQASPWLKVLTCDIRSENGAQMHGLCAIRLSDFESFGATAEKPTLTATVPFGCNTATEIEFGITCPARFLVELDSTITIQSMRNG